MRSSLLGRYRSHQNLLQQPWLLIAYDKVAEPIIRDSINL